ncbi:MAG: GNAT family N-acetyltransferase [Paludibacteraceae bacterium]
MEIIRLQSVDNTYWGSLVQLYTEAFPANQRRSVEELNVLINNQNKFYCNAVLMNKELVGFFNYWDLDEFFFVEHLAIEPPLRGHKLGEKTITLARTSVDVPLVLEAETAENSDWGSRRLEFYRRLGFEIIPRDYLQPPYEEGENYILLHLMSDNIDFATSNFEEIKKKIYEEVYRVSV